MFWTVKFNFITLQFVFNWHIDIETTQTFDRISFVLCSKNYAFSLYSKHKHWSIVSLSRQNCIKQNAIIKSADYIWCILNTEYALNIV